MLKERFEAAPAGENARDSYKKAIKQEAREINDDVRWENYMEANGPFAMIELWKRGILKPEDIERADAEKIDALKKKEVLTPAEKKELELRERGDMFYSVRHKKYAAFNPGGFIRGDDSVEAGYYKEIHYTSRSIDGVLDGEPITLEEVDHQIEPESMEELERLQPDVAASYKGKIYGGMFHGKIVTGVEAKKLLDQYRPFAEQRSKEIDELIREMMKKKEEEKRTGSEKH